MKRGQIAIAASMALVAIGLTAEIFFLTGGKIADLTAKMPEMPKLKAPSIESPEDKKLLLELASLGCALRLRQEQIKIAEMDACIEQAKTVPTDVFKYITRKDLGANWDELSTTEKTVAVAQATAALKVGF